MGKRTLGRKLTGIAVVIAVPLGMLVACSSSSSTTPQTMPMAEAGSAAACGACKTTAECPTGLTCSAGVCTKVCAVDMDCTGLGPASCDQGACGCSGHTVALCGTCTSTTDCVPGSLCLLGACKPKVTPAACPASACPAPLMCDPDLGCVCQAGSVDAGVGPSGGTLSVQCTGGTGTAGNPPPPFTACSASASFQAGFPAGKGYTITTTMIDAVVTEIAFAGDVAAVPTAQSAGAVTITGPSSSIMMSPAAMNAYTGMSASPLGQAGDALTIAAAGADVPKFGAMLALPRPATLSNPVQPVNQAPFVLDHTVPLSAIVSSDADAGTAGTLVVVLTGAASATSKIVLRAESPITGGSGGVTFSAAAIALLPIGTGGTIQMFVVSETTVMAGGTPVAVSATAQLYDGNGDVVFASTPLTVQ